MWSLLNDFVPCSRVTRERIASQDPVAWGMMLHLNPIAPSKSMNDREHERNSPSTGLHGNPTSVFNLDSPFIAPASPGS